LSAPISQAHAGTQPFVPPTITPGPTSAAVAINPKESTHTSSADAPPRPPGAGDALHKITSPIVGTFYRAASPTAEPFVQVGSSVGPDSVVCIIEAMKLMNEILAETSGTVVEVYVEHGQPVEFGQALFGIRK
jgi:acetyl-CoA carboxylase biotin carboxyl carrier protein